MAFSQKKFPAIRLSDIDDLMRENALDSSDGQKLIDYIRRKQGAGRPRLNLLLDGAENPINFRLDHLQPLAASLPPSKTNDATDASSMETTTGTASTNASPGIALVQPHSVNSRIASFITPSKNGTSSTPIAGSRECNPKSPSQRASPVHRLLSPSRIPVQRTSSSTNLSRKTLIKECQRANQMKCEILRQMVSSTPKPGEKQERNNDNFMSIRETISPIFEERGAPVVARVDAVQAQLNGTVPATQDQPDAVDRDARESTPPPGDGAMLVIPETPSPVHKSPMRVSSPFSALTLHRSPSMRKVTDQQQRSSMAVIQQQPKRSMAVESLRIDESVEHTPQKSILKKLTTKISVEPMVVLPSPRNRVSFSEKISVHQLSPAYVRSPRNSDVTSDESSEEGEEEDNIKVKQKKDMYRTSHGQKSLCNVLSSSTTKRTVQLRKSSLNNSPTRPIGQMKQLTRSEAFDESVDSVPGNCTNKESERTWQTIEKQKEVMHTEDRSPCRPQSLTRRSLSFDDIIRRGVVPQGDDPPTENGEENELETDRLEQNREQSLPNPVPSPVSSPKDKRKNQTNSDAINMVMEDSTRNGSSDFSNRQEHGQDNARSDAILDAITSPEHRTISTPMAITNIDTPRTVLMDIYDPPSAFCDGDTDDDNDDSSSLNNTPNEMEAPTRSTEETDPQRQSDKLSNSRKRRSVSPCPMETRPGVQSSCNTVLKKHERIVSVSSPQDHVSLKLTTFVDRLVTEEELVLPAQRPADGDEQARRETIVVPSKRRRAKPSIDNDTESYFQAVEQPQKTKDTTSKRGSQRRKLFPRENSEMVGELDENIPSPEPLPVTQEDEVVPETQPTVEPKNVHVSRPTTKSLAVIIERLSMATLKRLQEGQTVRKKKDAILKNVDKKQEGADTSRPKSPIEEKQNTEPSEKDKEASSSTGSDGIDSDRSGKSPPAPSSTGSDGIDIGTSGMPPPASGKPRRGRPRKNPNNVEQGQKYWKDVSNELRQHVESEGIRKSNRKRCLSKQVLMRNPTLSRNDEPKYVMPTYDEILVLYGQKEKTRDNSKNNVKNKKKVTKKPISTETRIDDDGFRIPPVPRTDGSIQTSDGKKRTVTWSNNQPETTTNGNGHCQSNGESHDSGLSSAVMTSDDVTETIAPPQRQKPSSSATVSLAADGDPKGQRGEESAVGASVGSTEDILTAKRQAMDWMYMLMENQQQRQAKLMAVDIQGFTHCSIDHLSFQRRGDIEYSFYIYSKYDNFGFVRFLPNAKKKMTRLNNFHLKFLILNGSLTFVINELEVKAVGGDFLLLPIGSSYKVLNGPDMSLMFMIKTIDGLRQ